MNKVNVHFERINSPPKRSKNSHPVEMHFHYAHYDRINVWN